MCLDGRIKLGPFVETRPMSQIEQVFDEAHHGKLKRRVILTPDF
jgi:6-hydroxycyclohex-1-ene-1-carbonyl-CoA dehydrogenase